MKIQTLQQGETFYSQDPIHIIVHSGRIWMTIAGEQKDYILNPGDSFRAEGRSSILLQGLQRSQLSFVILNRPELFTQTI